MPKDELAKSEAAAPKAATREYLFPYEGVTVEATSPEEAEAKLAALKETK